MKKIFILIGLLLFIPNIVSADVIMPGEKRVDYCFEIANINNYPDYTFRVEFPLAGTIEDINQGECKGFYKSDSPKIFAVDKSNNYFYSSLIIRPISTIPINDPREKIQDVLTITSINVKLLNLEKSKVIYYYTDSTKEEIFYQDQDIRPEPSQQPPLPWWFSKYFGLAFLITVFVEFLIIWIFFKGGPIKPLLVSFLINLITVSIANLLNLEFLINFFYLEIFVFVAETFFLLLIFKTSFFRAFFVSFLMNAATAMIGFYYFEPISTIISLK